MRYLNDSYVIYYMKLNPYWQLETYGSAFTIEAKWIKIALVIVCMITVGTNWLIPFILKKVKDIRIRHENKVLEDIFINNRRNIW